MYTRKARRRQNGKRSYTLGTALIVLSQTTGCEIAHIQQPFANLPCLSNQMKAQQALTRQQNPKWETEGNVTQAPPAKLAKQVNCTFNDRC